MIVSVKCEGEWNSIIILEQYCETIQKRQELHHPHQAIRHCYPARRLQDLPKRSPQEREEP